VGATASWPLLAAVLVSTGAAGLILVSGRRPNLRETWTLLAAVAKFGFVLALLPAVLAGEQPSVELFPITPTITLGFRADAAAMLLALSASALWLLTSIYSIGYVRGLDSARQTRYFASFALCMSATIGMAFSADLFTFFVFYELLTVATYPLVAHDQSPEALRAGRRYLGYLLAGGAALLAALAIVQTAAPGADFQGGGYLAGTMSDGAMIVVFALFTVGFGTKSALMPLHAWLPAAMVAPTPVSSLLHAVAVVKAGVFGFARATGYVIGPEVLADIGAAALLAAVAALTIVVASITAIRQDELKRLLAFSTIAHLSYIVLGLAVVSANGWGGSFLHIANHATHKITLFFCAGAIYVKAHVKHVSEMHGIARQMPVTLGAFTLAAFGLAGIPPMGGFVSKFFLIRGALDADQLVLATVLLLAGVLTAAYLVPVVRVAYTRPTETYTHRDEASWWMVGPIVGTALLSLLLGLGDLLPVGELASQVASSVTGGDIP
jgi:multicomponent Na+:H+ antiporter subunit D